MTGQYDRSHVESVLTRAGVPVEQRTPILDEIRYPIELDALQTLLARHGITRDDLISRLGGSP